MRAILLVFMLLVTAPAAWAQTGKHLALGGGINLHSYSVNGFSSKNRALAPVRS